VRVDSLRLERVEFMPPHADMVLGVLYYSERFKLAIHLCACGECRQKTVTPIDAVTGWMLNPDGPTLTPSIGNFQMPCKSHYFVTAGKVVWC
jgi:hypothetical protein